ncbi:glutamyl-tRNA(Gln) amidotransferase subunit C, mitochondrial [Orussus abietinus]|uniref:glutamyl-tRNA(Gln) amidotransferase subunit C, mitochondrial n=1 Tax=Orussus abietinus TaxID=222816 RepID=UPI000625ED46|nr:glutamyl-tRNA(Gln) amidotransferase subunit C, mitochondrial [Orussus abietinus]
MDSLYRVQCLLGYRAVILFAHSVRWKTIPALSETVEVKERKSSTKISKDTIAQLERLSLVDFDNEEGIRRLEAAIDFAKRLRDLKIDDSVLPMYTILENENLYLREDKVTEGNCRDKILKNATLLEEEYFVAPPGNIPKQ